MKAANGLMINTGKPIDVSQITDFVNNHAKFIPHRISFDPQGPQVPDAVKLAFQCSRSELGQPVDSESQFRVTSDGKAQIGQGFSPAMLALMGIDIADVEGPKGEKFVAFHDDMSLSAKLSSLESIPEGCAVAQLYIETTQGESLTAFVYYRAVEGSNSQVEGFEPKYEFYVQPIDMAQMNALTMGLMNLGGFGGSAEQQLSDADIEKMKMVYGPFQA